MTENKVKTLNQVVAEFYKDGEDEVANFKTRIQTEKDILKILRTHNYKHPYQK